MLISITPAAVAQDIYVNTSGWWYHIGTFNASTTPIQHAIDNATAGETICVRDGIYAGNVDVDRRLTIYSENGSANCVVQVPILYSSNVFDVTTSHVNISGFTITRGNHGIHIASADYCNISFNNVSNNLYGAYVAYSDHNLLLNNSAYSNLYGIYLTHSVGSRVVRNTARSSTC